MSHFRNPVPKAWSGPAHLLKAIFRDAFRLRYPVHEDQLVYIKSGVQWLCAAQDAFPGGGVARSFSLKSGWRDCYPETTGYIIPTLLNCSFVFQDQKLTDRALRMAHWLVDIQHADGGIQAGTVCESDMPPTIFNTGQVIFGWAGAYEKSKEERFHQSMLRAGRWLMAMQDEDGAWKKGKSLCTSYALNTYNTRTAWALLRVWQLSGDEQFKKSCEKNIAWSLKQQHANGWFANCCLDDNDQPLLHTIAYTVRGILEVGLALKDEAMIISAKLAADALLHKQEYAGQLAGRFQASWENTVSWTCLSANLQVALIWLRLYEYSGEIRYLKAARKSIRYCQGHIDLKNPSSGIRGGVQGSVPIWSPYCAYQYLNWSVKFLCDALLLDLQLRSQMDAHGHIFGNSWQVLPGQPGSLPYSG